MRQVDARELLDASRRDRAMEPTLKDHRYSNEQERKGHMKKPKDREIDMTKPKKTTSKPKPKPKKK